MSTASWRKNTAVIDTLAQHPYQFSFKQAVRVIERSNNYNDMVEVSAIQSVGRFMPPLSECIRFTSRQSLSFPSSEISSVEPLYQDNKENNQWKMELNFIGLTGSNGVLPYHYTETVLKRLKVKDKTISEFFNLFNHRTASLFYQSSVKYFAPLEYERCRLTQRNNTQSSNGQSVNTQSSNTQSVDIQSGQTKKSTRNQAKTQTDNFTKMLLALVGLGTDNLTDRLYTKDESLLRYAGLLSSSVRSASGLKQILESHFELPVEIKEFVGQWQPLIDDVRTRMPLNGAAGQNNQLGRTVMLGKSGFFAQGKINIILGPLTAKQLQKFTPQTPHLKALDELVRLYLGFEQDYSFILRTLKKELPSQVSFASKNKPILGWTSWLSSKSISSEHDNSVVDIPISVR
ncbi:type VI secretion system baseplate subunit TssG [Colwellia sp. 75C3]|uniref:type VI secretion system baseplate subunit TssG n=1 Tax=Colwellia sp. 75C3 TaxID=888425 RepID=UPI000C3258D1|nr:type VI secretion system baseplate subunit TssG [Colwellia sp. 75C3]PKG83045.1 type VI secretion system baseplate subunit TssG [Colwellia sp. 75C3]